MIKFSPKDSSVLAQVLAFRDMPREDRDNLLSQASEDTQKVVRAILNELPADQETPDVREAAQAVQDWMTQNRNIRDRNKERQQRLRALKAR
jgi:hypothetical protein